jgi:hypothetical protein
VRILDRDGLIRGAVLAMLTGTTLLAFVLAIHAARLRAELATCQERSPCALLGLTLGSLEPMLRADGGQLWLRTGPLAVALMPVVGQCSGDHERASAIASRLAEPRSTDDAIAALRELRALVQP